MLFYLLHRGIPYDCIWGYHEGWEFDRLQRAFVTFKAAEIEEQQKLAVGVAVGASTLFSPKAFEEFREKTSGLMEGLRGKTVEEAHERNQDVVNSFLEVFQGVRMDRG